MAAKPGEGAPEAMTEDEIPPMRKLPEPMEAVVCPRARMAARSGMWVRLASLPGVIHTVWVWATGSVTKVVVILTPCGPKIPGELVCMVLPCESRASVFVLTRVMVLPSASFWTKVSFFVAV